MGHKAEQSICATLQAADVSVSGVRISACIDGVEVGHAYVYFLKNDGRSENFAFGEDIFVDSEWRNRGIAKQLAEESIRVAQEHGCYKILGISRFGREAQHRRLESYGLVKYGYEFRRDLPAT